MEEPNIKNRLLKLDTCAVSDALDKLGISGVALGLKRMWKSDKIGGRVVTVKLKLKDNQPPTRHLGTAAVEAASNGDIIVVDHRGRENVAGWGGLLSLSAKLKGVGGVIIDGACRDVDESEENEFPVYARNSVPLTARGRIVEESFNERIEICGVEVNPNDYVLADGTGVVFIPQEHADSVIKLAEELALKENKMADDVKKGESIMNVMGKNYETMLN